MRPCVFLLMACALALLGAERPGGLGDVVDVRHWSYDDYTRVVVELDAPVRTEGATRLAADSEAGRPERLFLDLDGIWVGRRFVDGVAVEDGLLRGFRLGQNTNRRSRLVIDLDRYERHRVLTLTHPHRLVIDIYGARDGPLVDSEEGSSVALPAALRSIRTVVVDAGHGGRDPGAIGVNGIREKQVTLRVANALGEELEARGLHVVYTRRDDRTLSLEERTVLAGSADGDLFVSVHANAARRRSVHGVETYYLDKSHERHAMELAARENGIPRGEVNALQQTLAKLHMEEVSPQSRRLAQIVQKQLVTGLPKKRRPQDLGVKKGPFYVLFLSNMPAILVEVGFLTHRGEAKRLRDEGYLKDLAAQIAEGIALYKGEQDTRLAQAAKP